MRIKIINDKNQQVTGHTASGTPFQVPPHDMRQFDEFYPTMAPPNITIYIDGGNPCTCPTAHPNFHIQSTGQCACDL